MADKIGVQNSQASRTQGPRRLGGEKHILLKISEPFSLRHLLTHKQHLLGY